MDASIKAARLADQIRDYLATWCYQDHPGFIFSITDVTLSKDLGRATAWIQSSNDENTTTKLLKSLNHNAREYQRKLYRSLNKFKAPQILFALDRSPEMGKHFDNLLNR